MVAEVHFKPKINREKITQIMLESFWVEALYFANAPILSLNANDWTTGLVCDSNDDVTSKDSIYGSF